MCLRLDCCHSPWVSRLVVVLLSHLPEFYSCTMLLCSWVLSQQHHLLAYSMLMVFRRSLANLLEASLDEQLLSLRRKPSWVTWVRTLAGTGHKFACYRLQAMRSSPGVSGPLTHLNCCFLAATHLNCCFLAATGFMLLKVTGQSLLRSVHDPLLEIPS